MKRKAYGVMAAFFLGIFATACAGKEESVTALTPEPTVTALPTETPTPEATATATPTPEATPIPEATATPTPTPEVTATVPPTAMPTPEATAMPTQEATPTPEVTATPTPEATATPTPEPTAVPTPEDTRKISNVKIYTGKTVEAGQAKQGDVVLFGAYEQDGNTENGLEVIAWKVLEKQENRLLLLSMYVLDAKAFHHTVSNMNWNGSDLRAWMQTEFYEAAFSALEQNRIQNSEAGSVFLLSLEEVQRCFSVEKSELYLQNLSDERLAAGATDYAKEQGVWTMDGKACWWLRSEGKVSGTAIEVTEDGSLYLLGTELDYSYNGVRPAIWLEIQ